MSTLNGHFGIGEDQQIDRITVCWPSGITDEILNPAINQNLIIIEGENEVGVSNVQNIAFDVFPNPASHEVMLQGITQSQVSILDISGKIVERANAMQQRVDISQLAPGVYFIQANTVEGIQQKKFIKQ
jgi:hypothetical protein